ncbi:tetraacyldisaccharide 4'-kinase [Oceanospirillum linum]|uniref:Tetraacyldisaccharide 4'-kinase n=1 Tax=Oceanospirillum linum TaxID=966 RepID=A0A1T1HEL6_OCELI|nr:tetraacyldisaccharide 4'-kinase [Oceanospirillum linum]OOV88266.1 tetraacyldisaccharide 4'-kinase [Oceanospirillum linum]SEF50318.1 lipid-A-disaccharide kinase [Oleiphilus messinensis]SMP03816.1 lipid-A-disaccharide kinase [Oceanospirillum linum]
MKALEKAWYSGAKWPLLLWPVEVVYRYLARKDQAKKRAQQRALPVPVIVVGNVSVGGTGKSPMVSMLCRVLQHHGWHPGVISRGYGGKKLSGPVAVTAESDAADVGDEPVMLAAQTDSPVVVDQDRYRAARALLDTTFFQKNFPGHTACNLIISDDGLQHLSLPRDIEWVIVDASRGLGNGHCLPVGPLREPAQRLKEVDLVLANGSNCPLDIAGVQAHPMKLSPRYWRNLRTGETFSAGRPPFKTSQRRPAFAMAGIGNPERFFQTLEELELHIERHPFPDHHIYKDHEVPDGRVVLMTAKDAVKCRSWSEETYWALDVEARIKPDLIETLHHQLLTVLKRKHHG